MTEQVQTKQNLEYCHKCKKNQPTYITSLEGDGEANEDLIACSVCNEGIIFI